MKSKLLPIIACLLVFVMCFVGCSSNSNGNNESAEIITEDVGEIGGQLDDGTYVLVGMYDDAEKIFIRLRDRE